MDLSTEEPPALQSSAPSSVVPTAVVAVVPPVSSSVNVQVQQSTLSVHASIPSTSTSLSVHSPPPPPSSSSNSHQLKRPLEEVNQQPQQRCVINRSTFHIRLRDGAFRYLPSVMEEPKSCSVRELKLCKKETSQDVGTKLSETQGLPDFVKPTLSAIEEILYGKVSKSSYESLYQYISQICSDPQGGPQTMYELVRDMIDEYIFSEYNHKWTKAVEDKLEAVPFLQLILDNWDEYKKRAALLRNVLSYYDGTYATGDHRTMTVLPFTLFGKMISKDEIKPTLIESLMTLTEAELHSRDMARCKHIRAINDMLYHLSLFNELFGEPFLIKTKQYYAEQAAYRLNELTANKVIEYFEFVDHSFELEMNRIDSLDSEQHCLQQIKKDLENAFVFLLINARLADLLNEKTMEPVFEQLDLWPRIHVMVRWVSRVQGGFNMLVDLVASYLKAKARALIMALFANEDKESRLIYELIEFKAQIEELARVGFDNNSTIVLKVREAMEYAVNIRTNKAAEQLAICMDEQLWSSGHVAENFDLSPNNKLNWLLTHMVALYDYLSSKDYFDSFYQRLFARRLLTSQRELLIVDEWVLGKIRQVQDCSYAFVTKCKMMIKDTLGSRELTAQFVDNLVKSADSSKHELVDADCGKLRIDVSFTVLNTGIWPTVKEVDYKLPSIFKRYQNEFITFYHQHKSVRRLSWPHHMSHMILKATFDNGNTVHELRVSFLQALILLLFDEENIEHVLPADQSVTSPPSGAISYTTFHRHLYDEEATARRFPGKKVISSPMEDLMLRHALHSLSSEPCMVLCKEPPNGEIGENDYFWVNDQFKHQYYRITINRYQPIETMEENITIRQQVFQDRQHQLDAAIVRIMKHHKLMTQQELIAEVYSKITFSIPSSDIMKRIECLIRREFVRQKPPTDGTDTISYEYLC